MNAARSFLDGFNSEPLTSLEDAMRMAAEGRFYERAARIRDDLRALEYLHRKLVWLAEARRKYSFVYSVSGEGGEGIWYLIRSGEVADVAAAPVCRETYRAARNVVRRWRDATDTGDERGYGPYPHTLSLVAAWFRKNADQLTRTFHPGEAGRKYRQMARSAVA